VELCRKADGEVVSTQPVRIPAGTKPQAIEVEVPLPEEGVFELRFSERGEAIPPQALMPLQVLVVDTTPVASSSVEPRRTLVAEIDCVERAPDYFKGGETRVVTKPFGKYREGGDVGYLQNMNAEKPSWFAYTVSIPHLDRPYVVEVDYPDDTYRSMIAQIRQGLAEKGSSHEHTYVMGVGADSGGEFTLSNRLQTFSALVWPTSRDWRINLITPQTGSRPAASRIRVYEVEGELAPMPGTKNGRTYAQWFEEGFSYLSVFGGSNRSPEDLMRGTDQWLRSAAYAGANRVIPTVSVYQMAMYPSRHNIHFCTPDTLDAVRLILLYCEKYGMTFAGEFHPEARELLWLENRDSASRQNSLRNNKGQLGEHSPLYHPLHPVNQEWYLGMLKEFAERYQDSPAFKGVSLRIMDWANPALNNFHSLEWGYDDYTIGRFEQDTGVRVPVKADDPRRFGKRYTWLLNQEKERWIAWRCEKITELHWKIVATVRAVRPDLVVQLGSGDADRREWGLDLKALAAIDGLELVQNLGTYGRRKTLLENQVQRDRLVVPSAPRVLPEAGGKPAYAFGQAYFEATEHVAPPQDLGYPADTPHGWMSGVVEPSGIHSVERWALALAETDARFFQDGGNAYTLGQPRNREFFRHYRQLPDIAFTARKDARDPVAVWSAEDGDGFWFYAVNREGYDVPVSLKLRANGNVVRPADRAVVEVKAGRLDVVLKPYELIVWRALKGSAIEGIRVMPPAAEVAKVRAQIEWFEELAKRIDAEGFPVRTSAWQRAFVTETAVKSRAAFDLGQLRTARNYLEHHDLMELYETLKQYPPRLRDNGAVQTPVSALDAGALLRRLETHGDAALTDTGRLNPNWTGAQIVVAEADTLSFTVEAAVDGRFLLQLGIAEGGDFGGAEIAVDGRTIGAFGQKNTKVVAGAVVTLEDAIALSRGRHLLTLRRQSGARLGVQFMEWFPLRQPLVAGGWSVLGPFHVVPSNAGDEGMKRSFSAAETRGDEAGEAWRPLTGESPYVDFRELTGGGLGTVHYARTHLYSPRDYTVRLSYGMDYWAKIWLNGELIQDTLTQGGGTPVPYGFQRDLRLKKGANELLFKVASGSAGNGLWAGISNPGDITVSATAN
ncbi:MAG: hypothetical protein K0R17_3316, partial [Rariglobus sp.]|nr:hypothetical protein [Rariglobus sp.]